MITESPDVPIATAMGGLSAVSEQHAADRATLSSPWVELLAGASTETSIPVPLWPPASCGPLWASLIPFLGLSSLTHQMRDLDYMFDKILFFDLGVLCPLLSKMH